VNTDDTGGGGGHCGQTTNTSVAVGEYNNATGQWNCGHVNAGTDAPYCLDATMGYTTEYFLWQSGDGSVFDAVNHLNETSPCACNATVDEFCAWGETVMETHEQAIKASLGTLRADVRPLLALLVLRPAPPPC
jgi:hypothetical protein